MSSFTLYGLDENGAILSGEKLAANSLEALQLARDWLGRFASVELWEVSVCVARMRRQSPPPE